LSDEKGKSGSHNFTILSLNDKNTNISQLNSELKSQIEKKVRKKQKIFSSFKIKSDGDCCQINIMKENLLQDVNSTTAEKVGKDSRK
jgi:hypothetical protein